MSVRSCELGHLVSLGEPCPGTLDRRGPGATLPSGTSAKFRPLGILMLLPRRPIRGIIGTAHPSRGGKCTRRGLRTVASRVLRVSRQVNTTDP